MLTVLLQVAAALVGAVLLWVFWLHYKCTMAPVPGGRRIPGPPQTPLFGHVLPLLKRAEFHYEYVHQLVLKYVSGSGGGPEGGAWPPPASCQ